MATRPLFIRKTRRGAYTLLEMVVAAGAASVIVVGLAATVAMSGRAFEGTGGTKQRARAAEVQADLMADLSCATSFTAATASSLTFTVPDRNANGSEETLSYAYTGLPTAQLTYSINGGTAVPLLSDVQASKFSFLTRGLPGPTYIVPTLDPSRWGERWKEGPYKFGWDTTFGRTTGSDNKQTATKAVLKENGTLTQITAFIYSKTKRYAFAIYTDAGGKPGSLIAQSALTPGTNTTGWHTLAVPSTSLNAGTYWLALSFEEGGQAYYYADKAGDTHVYSYDAIAKGGFDPVWASTSYKNWTVSIYGTYTK